MPAVAVLVHTPCHVCGTANPFRAYVHRHECKKCGQKSQRLDWSWVIDCDWSKPTIGKQASEEGESRRNVLGQVTPAAVECPKCKSIFLQPAIERAYREDSGADGQIFCERCKNPLLIRRVPSPDRDAYGFESRIFATRWCAIIGEDPSLVRDESPPTLTGAPLSVAFQCTGCGAPFAVDGSNRTPLCKFCNTRVFLPDSLWDALHPAPPIRPFYLWLDKKGVEQRKYLDKTAAVKKRWYIVTGLWSLSLPIAGACMSSSEPMNDFLGPIVFGYFASLLGLLIGVWAYGAVRNRRVKPLAP